ncbi:hypothetical protein GWK36_01140 [Caldichromatium japonicum]|uniref:FimV N-terminal domain-containing protein n=1 Tax=Caldichromatium japonicum TaxID=2699430 RepID=A0A6G7V9Y7_9GAMM|nr:FimV/HubP family polar landmark protein [Caldichromatium japonicum]QIK36831.1 hypothetical protein GWK36_01140 [Caldichromatium japonicum]
MNRTLKLVSAMAAVLSGSPALALELGALRTESALNQPFSGSIELSDVKAEELDAVRVELAPPEAFAKAKIERYYYLTQLRFIPEAMPDGRTQVRVTSSEPMREPYLDFLVQVTWPNGRFIKSYTVLLDPPTLAERRAPSIQTVRAGAVSTMPAGRQVQTGERSAAGTVATGDYLPPPGEGFPVYIGPVAPGEGLWALARRHAPAGATAAQTALALYRCNQGAFVRGNINRLIAGKTLVIPSRAELFALDADSAWREFQAAIKGRQINPSPLTPVTPEMLAHLRVVGTATPVQPVPSPSSSGQAAAVPLPAPTTAMPQPSPDVLQAIETSETARQEAAEMRQRIQELEAQLAEIQNQLKRRDAELARVQSAAQQPVSLTGEQPAQALQSELVAESPSSPPASETAAESTETAGQAGTLGVEAPTTVPLPTEPPDEVVDSDAAFPPPGPIPLPEVEPAPAVPVQPAESPKPAASPQPHAQPQQPPSAVGSTWYNLLLPIAGLAGLTAVGILLFSLLSARRRQAQIEEEESEEYLVLDRPDQTPAQPQPTSTAGAEDQVSLAKKTTFASTHPLPIELESEEEGPPSLSTDFDDTHTEYEDVDALSEADIYIAYGRHREARTLLEKEIRRDPQRLELKYKLADALAAGGERDALKELLDEIQAAGGDKKDPEQWERLQRLWRESTPTIMGEGLAARVDSVQGHAARAPEPVAPAPAVSAVEPTSRSSQPASDIEDLSLDLMESLEVDQSQAKPEEAAPAAIQPPPQVSKPASTPASKPAPAAELPSLEEELDKLLPLIESGQGLNLKLPEIEAGSARTSKPAEEPSISIDSSLSSDRESVPSDLLSSQWQVDSGIWDEVATKLDLARAYIEMNDQEAAREILEEVLNEGRDDQRKEAQALIERLGRSG